MSFDGPSYAAVYTETAASAVSSSDGGKNSTSGSVAIPASPPLTMQLATCFSGEILRSAAVSSVSSRIRLDSLILTFLEIQSARFSSSRSALPLPLRFLRARCTNDDSACDVRK